MLIVQHLWDLLFFLVILFGPLPLCLSLIIVGNGKGRLYFTHCLLVLLTSWCFIEVCIGLILGIVQKFTLSAVLVSELIVFLAGIMLFIYIKRCTSSFSFRNLTLLNRPLNNLETLIIGAVSSIGLFLLWNLATNPITDYDSLDFHLPTVARWYQTASFTMLHQFSQISRYPYNWEVLCTLFLMPFREDFLVTFPNLIAWALLGLSVYLLSVKIGVTRTLSMAVASLVLTLPIMMENVNTMHVDLPLASFFMVGLYFAVTYNRMRSFLYLMLFLATLGMLSGIKTSGPIYGFLLVATLGLLEVRTIFLYRTSTDSIFRPFKFVLPICVVGIFCFLLLGGFWYLRNLIEVGNPLGYVRIQFANVTVFAGTRGFNEIHRTTLANLFDPTDLLHWKILAGQIQRNLHFPFLAMALQVLLLPLAFVIGQRKIKNEYLIGLMALLIGTGFLYWHTPYSGDDGAHQWQVTGWIGQGLRYALPFMGVLGVAAAASAASIRTFDKGMAAIVLINSMLIIAEIFPEQHAIFYIALALLLGWGLFKVIQHIRFIPSVPRMLRLANWLIAILMFTGLMFATTLVAREKRDIKRTQVYGGIVEYIAKNIGKDETIGYLLGNRIYLFYGKEFNRKVLYTPANSYKLSQWLHVLQERGVSVIAVGPLPGEWMEEEWKASRERLWLEDTDGPFTRVFGQDPKREPVLYRLKSNQRAGGLHLNPLAEMSNKPLTHVINSINE